MPFDATFFQLPCGARCVRLDIRGAISTEESLAHIKRVDLPEGDLHGLPQLVHTREMVSLSPEARRLFGGRGEQGEQEPWVAVIVTNPVLRVTTNFINRVQRARRTRLFSAEAEALKWLDERVGEALAARPREV